jgi:hypothetical protein
MGGKAALLANLEFIEKELAFLKTGTIPQQFYHGAWTSVTAYEVHLLQLPY